MKKGLMTAAVAAVLIVAGCGGDNDSETDTAEDQASENALTFTASTVDGEEFDAADVAGTPTVFWFWAPWCSTCVAEAPHVLDLVDAHGEELDVIGVASLGEPAEMQDFIKLTETPELVHLNDEPGDVWRHFGITEQSTFALVDADGSVVHSGFLGPDELAEQVSALVG
jgi:thiol-disulfide isomerase/thioredoxin